MISGSPLFFPPNHRGNINQNIDKEALDFRIDPFDDFSSPYLQLYEIIIIIINYKDHVVLLHI